MKQPSLTIILSSQHALASFLVAVDRSLSILKKKAHIGQYENTSLSFAVVALPAVDEDVEL